MFFLRFNVCGLVCVTNKRPLSDEESALMGDALASRGEIRRQE